jgi:hypothetical protein
VGAGSIGLTVGRWPSLVSFMVTRGWLAVVKVLVGFANGMATVDI